MWGMAGATGLSLKEKRSSRSIAKPALRIAARVSRAQRQPPASGG